MEWSEYRTSHLNTYGPTTRAQLSKDYANYKKLQSKRPASPKKSIKQVSPKKSVPQVKAKQIASPKKPVQQVKQVSRPALAASRPGLAASKKKGKLTLKDIDQMAKNKKFLIVVLYSDNCGHCRDMKTKLGSKMKNTDKIMFYSDDMIDDSLKEYYPRIFYYENGERQNDLNVDDVYDYVL